MAHTDQNDEIAVDVPDGPYEGSHSEAMDFIARIDRTLGRDWLRALVQRLPKPPPTKLRG